MDMNNTPEPRMPRVENLEFLDLMGVILSLCTMRSVSTRASAIARRGKFTRRACGYMDDRRCRPAALPPLPDPARKARKCSPSPTSPQAPPPTSDLISDTQPALVRQHAAGAAYDRHTAVLQRVSPYHHRPAL